MVTTTLIDIYKASAKFLRPLSLEQTYAVIVQEAHKLVGGKYGSLILYQNGELERVYSTLPLDQKSPVRKTGHTYKAFVNQEAMVLNINQFRGLYPELEEIGVKSTLFIPLTNRGKAIGVILINSTSENQFTSEDLNVVMLFGSQASLAIRKAQLYDENAKALELRDLFISMAAHELRTPLTTINGYIELLNTRFRNQDSAESRWVYELKKESLRLTELVQELLQINNIQAGQFSYLYRKVNLRVIISRSINNFKFAFPERKIRFIDQTLPDSSDQIVADFDKLVQACQNLIENAIKYSLPETEIMVTLSCNAKYFTIAVKDQGVGISKEDLPIIFDRFQRGSRSPHQGMGLGLYLVETIIRNHRGTIKVHSKINQGSEFIIKLPKA